MKELIITKIKNGKITIPKELLAEWPGSEVVIMRSARGFTVKSITPPSLTALSTLKPSR